MFYNFSGEEIDKLYSKYVKKNSFYLSWIKDSDDISDFFSDSIKLKGLDAPRVFCLLDFKLWLAKYKLNPKDVLVTEKDDPEIKLLPETCNLYEYKYEDGHDLHIFDVPKKDFDFALISQTIEHLHTPSKMMKHIFHHLKPGGYFFTSVPTTNIPHNTPIHFQHFYPIGLILLGLQSGFEVVEVGFWGNKEYIIKMFSTNGWPDIYQLNTLENDILYPAGCWALFRKPETIA
jgi:SAM-dependent methyltransferase